MTELVLTQAFAHGLGPLDARFENGLSVVLGASPDDLASLCELLTGVRPARRGSVVLDGDDVGTRPSARRRILSLLREEELLASSSVSRSLSEASALRGSRGDVEHWLAEAGVRDLGPRAAQKLGPTERRAAALAMALGANDAAVLALYEPLLLVPRVSERFVLERCRSRAEGAIVIVLTGSLEHALRLGGSLYWLERGRLQDPKGAAPRAAHALALWVRLATDSADVLAAALRADAEVSSLGHDARERTRALWVRGADPERVASSICRHARALGLAIDALRPLLPTLDSVLLSRAGWTDPSYHAASGVAR